MSRTAVKPLHSQPTCVLCASGLTANVGFAFKMCMFAMIDVIPISGLTGLTANFVFAFKMCMFASGLTANFVFAFDMCMFAMIDVIQTSGLTASAILPAV